MVGPNAETAIHTLAMGDHPLQAGDDHSSADKGLPLDMKASVPHFKANEGVTQPIEQEEGVTRIEALYLVFGKGWGLYALWGSIALIAYVYSLSRSTTVYYAAFATSHFGEHTIIGTIGVIRAILAGVSPPFIAKLADVWSRPHALTLSVICYSVGYAMCAGATNVTTVVAGQVVYTLGNTGITFLNSLIIADITSLQWRAFVDGAINVPYVLNAFVAGYITTGINGYSDNGWRWGFGMFCILLPVCVSPALAVLLIGDRRAKQLGALSLASSSYVRRRELSRDPGESSNRTLYQSVRFYWTRLNAFGLLLMGFGFALILTPITLSSTATGGYKNPSLIAMLVIGGVLFISWCIWDGFYAQYPFMPKRVFNRTFVACVTIDFFFYFASYLIDGYFASWVYVIVDWSDRNYTFFNNTVTVAMCGFAIFSGLVMRYTHRYKYLQTCGIALFVIGTGLTYRSTMQPTDAVLVLSQCFIGFGGAISVSSSYTAVQASVPHQDMAIAVAVLNLWASVGSSIAIAISTSVWNKNVPANLEKYAGSVLNATERAEIFGSIYVARLAEPRSLIKQAYLDSTNKLFLAALIVSFGSLIACLFTSNYYLGNSLNAVEVDKVVKFRTAEEINEELNRRAKARDEAAP
ncbi:uncharacterized protein IL334_004483 [Kwoniella shivajii]|uniref:Major facilitator superfamily (MFS) profile domain-containing protein n=1 Tax=Kwoniella shivajii TaxID=564305 RepID=A0ABZ1D0E7_9TREE|nr:hypothetical protein IL334_004483 [Kwoniella shivajii]